MYLYFSKFQDSAGALQLSLARLLSSSLALSEIALSASHAKSFRSGELARSGNHFNTSSVVRYLREAQNLRERRYLREAPTWNLRLQIWRKTS